MGSRARERGGEVEMKLARALGCRRPLKRGMSSCVPYRPTTTQLKRRPGEFMGINGARIQFNSCALGRLFLKQGDVN